MYHPPGKNVESATAEIPNGHTLSSGNVKDDNPLVYIKNIFYLGGWKICLALFVLAATVFSLFAWERVAGPSENNHFVYLADTLNTMVAAPFSEKAKQKRDDKLPFELNRHPPHNNDWASWWDVQTEAGGHYRGIWLDEQGDGRFKTLDGKAYFIKGENVDHTETERRYFVSFPPMPAVLMMPGEAIWGYDFNDVVFTILFAALNVVLIYLLLMRLAQGGRTGRSRGENLWLTLLFGFGTCHLWCSVLGEVWFTALIVGITFTLLYLLFAIDAEHPFAAGLFAACGFATRASLLFSVVFILGFLLFPGGNWRKSRWGPAIKKWALFCAPCLVIGGGLLAMNYVRFGSVVEFGHTYLSGGSIGRIQDYGLFNYHFLSKNLSALLTLLPKLKPEYPYIIVSKHGMSLFLTTPAFFYLFLPEERTNRRDKFWWRLLWITVGCVAVPALYYQNTGYAQFGYRFSLDYTPYLICLLAVGRRPLSWLFKTCVIAGIAVNAFGAVTFKRFEQFYADKFFVG